MVKMKKLVMLYLFILLIEFSYPFCTQSQASLININLGESKIFYLKAVKNDANDYIDNFYIVGNQKEATIFSFTNINANPLAINSHKLTTSDFPYIVYADSFGYMNPVVIGSKTNDNNYNLKYILSEGLLKEEEFSHALYDVNKNEMKEGQFSYVFPDYKILEPLNENEYIGAVKICNTNEATNTNICSIKLQIMSFTQTLNGNIKQLGGKEYAEIINLEQTVNDIFYIKSLKKILIIRTIVSEIYFDIIDYDNYFGALQVSKKIISPFSVKDFRFKSITLMNEEDRNPYIVSCFRKLNFVYCISGYYDKEKNDFVFLQNEPKLILTKCNDNIYRNVTLYQLSPELGIVGCPGDPYYAVRFNITLDPIGSPIKFPKSYSEFVVINSSTLFVMYSKENIGGDAYELYGCIYYLPVCHSGKRFSLKENSKFDFKKLIEEDPELQNIDYISIKYPPIYPGRFKKWSDNSVIDVIDTTTHLQNQINFKDLYYDNAGQSVSFEEVIHYIMVNPKEDSDIEDEDSISQECVLTIINCYETCLKCEESGDENNNNCKDCDNTTNYFIEDSTSKQCLKKDNVNGNEYYYFDSNNKVFKRCYIGCKKCKGESDSNYHYCTECNKNNNFYEFGGINLDGEPTLNCFLETQPPEGYYFDESKPDTDKFQSCVDNKCASCIKNSGGGLNCIKCKTSGTTPYYALFNEDRTNAECLDVYNGEGYYLDKKAGEYKKCYPSCETCSKSGNDEYNNCITCKERLEIYSYGTGNTCKCKYNFYYKINGAPNKKDFECTETRECPSSHPYLIINSQNIRQCVTNCPSNYGYKYNNQCYDHVLNGTLLTSVESDCQDDDLTYDQCVINDYIHSSIPLSQISKAQDDYVNNYKDQYNSNSEDYTYNHVNMIRNNDGEYILLVFENEKCIEKFTTEYGLGYTDLTDYSSKIKSENGIQADEPLIYTYLYTYNQPVDLNGTPVENLTYGCYNSETGEKLNLTDILDGENVTKYVPAPSGSDYEKLKYLSKYSNLGIDFSDPNSEFFNSQCFLFTSDNGKDVTLADRRKYFFNNIKICEEDCVFIGLDENSKSVKCSCPYKSSSGDGTTITKSVTFPDYDEDYFIFDMWKCLSKKMVEGKELKKSYITIIVFCILLLTILLTFLYFCCCKNKFQFMSKLSSQYSSVSRTSQIRSMSQKEVSVKNQKNNPPKKEANGDTDSNLMKEKGYVHDAKRPFNYDNNNLFFHADENYIIGNKNLNSLFMGQNFQNDYSENMEQLNNNEKKPKPVINNYNNINIPGRKINKANSKKVPKVNNFSNINIGPDIINIKKTNPEPSSNKDNKTRNGPLILKNDPSEIDSSDRFKKEITPLNAPNLNNNKTIKIKPDDSSEKSCTNYSNKKSLLSNRDNNSLNGKIPELNKENYDDDIKKACDEIGEENMKINMADYETASKTDSREFCSFYFNQLKHRQIFFYTAYFHKYAENVFMKIMIAIFHILLCLFLNVFWYRTFYVHSEFISPINNHSTFSSKYAWFRILLSVLFYIIIICLLHLIYLPQLRIYYSLSNDKLDNNQKLEIMEKNVKCMKINYIIFIVFNFCFLIVLLLYILVFSYVFQNSKTDLMISFILTVVITQALPFIFVFFVTVFRFIGLKCNIPCFYNFSLIFTI